MGKKAKKILSVHTTVYHIPGVGEKASIPTGSAKFGNNGDS